MPTKDAAVLNRLQELADDLRGQNPGRAFLADDKGVWLREGGTDYAVYSLSTAGDIVLTFEGGRCFAHRPTPTCDACRVHLDAGDGCPCCGVSHAGDPCPTCGRRGLHAADCTDPGDPWREAGPATDAKGGQS